MSRKDFIAGYMAGCKSARRSKRAGYSRELFEEFMDYADGHPMLSGKDDDYRRVFFKGADEALQWLDSIGRCASRKTAEPYDPHFPVVYDRGMVTPEMYFAPRIEQIAQAREIGSADAALILERDYVPAEIQRALELLCDKCPEYNYYPDKLGSCETAKWVEGKKISRKKTASDGWNSEFCEYLIDVLDNCEELSYEVKNARRGSYCRNAGDTYGSLGAYASRLGEELANAGDELIALYGDLTSEEIDEMD